MLRAGYPFTEPSGLEQIRGLRRGDLGVLPVDKKTLRERISGAWYGRIAGCMLGKLDAYKSGVPGSEVFDMIHEQYDDFTSHGWCHTNSNAMIVAASLLCGEGDFGKSVCMAVETGFDTDCNGAKVGSVFGMAHGASAIPECWTKPFGDKLNTQIFGITSVKISDCIDKTLEHIGG